MPFNSINHIDEIALYQSTIRIPGETDEQLVQRIKDTAKALYGTGYDSLKTTLPLQGGGKQKQLLSISCTDIFEVDFGFEYVEVRTFPLVGEGLYFRIFINNSSIQTNVIQKIVDTLTPCGKFTFHSFVDNYPMYGNKMLVRGSNAFYTTEFVTDRSFRLLNANIIPGSESSSSNVLSRRMNSVAECVSQGDYFIDYKLGFIYIYSNEQPRFYLSYKYTADKFFINATTISLVPLEMFYKYGITDATAEYMWDVLDQKSIGA